MPAGFCTGLACLTYVHDPGHSGNNLLVLHSMLRLLKYQSLLLEGPVTKLKVCGNLNPATFLPEKENETPGHDCSQFLTLNYAAREDLKDTPLDNPDMEIFSDGSSFV